jgi:anti-sigma B factor antagonist/stage II sporulation protein AA (anti-sigma F factor antagonist)
MELTSARFADTIVVSPAGRIDHETAEPFRQALLAQLVTCAAGQDHVVLDLGRVEYIASAGLRALMLAARQAKAKGGRLAVAALQPVVKEVFEITRFGLVLDVFPSVRDALQTLSADAVRAFTVPTQPR